MATSPGTRRQASAVPAILKTGPPRMTGTPRSVLIRPTPYHCLVVLQVGREEYDVRAFSERALQLAEHPLVRPGVPPVAQAPCPLADAPRPRRREPIRLDAGWLEKRFDLFERYRLPSVAAQAAGSFHWIVYFDSATPPRLRDRIEEVPPDLPLCGTLRNDPDFRVLAALIGGGCNYPHTLDTDHSPRQRRCLARDHVARLQAAVSRKSAVRDLELSKGLRTGQWSALRSHPPSERFRELVRALGRPDPHRHLDRPPEDEPLRRHCADRRASGLAASDPRWKHLNKVRGRRVLPAEAAGHFPAPLLSCLRPVGSAEIALENRLPHTAAPRPRRRVVDASRLRPGNPVKDEG